MGKTAKEFVANDLWMAIAILTLGAIVLLGSLGLGAVSGVVVAIGWFVLTPLLLFWGAEIAEFLYGAETPQGTDALTELKGRYARGEIDDAEFEQRLERLIELDELSQDTRRVAERTHRSSAESEPESPQSEDGSDPTEEPVRNRNLES